MLSNLPIEAVTPALPTDAEAIHRLIVDGVGQSYLRFTIYQSRKSIRYIRDRIEGVESSGVPEFFVIRCDAALAGFYSAVRRGDEFFLNYVVTAPFQRSCGTGTLLLRHFESVASSLGCTRVGLHVFAGNELALAWYLRKGYEINSSRYHFRLASGAMSAEAGGELEVDHADLLEALAVEEARGFSSVGGYFLGSPVRLGFIDGVVCNILSPQGRTAIPLARAAAQAFAESRRWILLISPELLPEEEFAESMEMAFCMVKRLPKAGAVLDQLGSD